LSLSAVTGCRHERILPLRQRQLHP
jgi:hypothetical protein